LCFKQISKRSIDILYISNNWFSVTGTQKSLISEKRAKQSWLTFNLANWKSQGGISKNKYAQYRKSHNLITSMVEYMCSGYSLILEVQEKKKTQTYILPNKMVIKTASKWHLPIDHLKKLRESKWPQKPVGAGMHKQLHDNNSDIFLLEY